MERKGSMPDFYELQEIEFSGRCFYDYAIEKNDDTFDVPDMASAIDLSALSNQERELWGQQVQRRAAVRVLQIFAQLPSEQRVMLTDLFDLGI